VEASKEGKFLVFRWTYYWGTPLKRSSKGRQQYERISLGGGCERNKSKKKLIDWTDRKKGVKKDSLGGATMDTSGICSDAETGKGFQSREKGRRRGERVHGGCLSIVGRRQVKRGREKLGVENHSQISKGHVKRGKRR